MNFRGVEPDRMSMLLEYALTDDEFQAFFSSSQKRLLLAGEHKIQRLPGNREEAIRTIVRFSEKAHGVLSEWLKTEAAEHSDHLVNQLAPRFLAIERQGVVFDEDEMQELARCGLDNLYSDQPDESWLQFLASEPPHTDSEEGESAGSSGQEKGSIEYTEATLEAFVAWARGESPLSAIDDPRVQLLARIEEAARSGNANAEVTGELPPHFTRVRERLQTPRVAPVSPPHRGVQAAAPKIRSLDPDANYTGLQVVATRTGRFTGSTYFLEVEGFIDQRDVFTLSDPDLKVALPEEGRVILFPDVGITPAINRPMSYDIERFNNQRPIKVRALSRGRPLYEVVYVPHHSNEPESVREWILQTAKKGRALNPVFVTNDGLCLKARAEPLSRVEAAEFDWLLDSWPSIAATEFRHGTFVLGPLTPSSTRYDCAPLAASARRLFRTLSERKAIKVSREQMNAIVDYLRAEEADELKSARQSRILGRLATLSRRDEEYDQLIAELMSSQAVREDIEARKQSAVADAKLGVQKEHKQLTDLRRQREATEEQLEKLKAELDERVTDMRRAMRRAFDSARNKEAETLADLALWQVLSGHTGVAAPAATPPAAIPESDPQPRCKVSELGSATDDPADVFRTLGLPEELSKLTALAMAMAAEQGLPIVFAGAGASAVGLRAARSFQRAAGVCIDVPLGLTSDDQLTHCLASGNRGVLLLRNANLADMCLYAPVLLDRLVTGILDPPSEPKRVVILTAASGPAALPWPAEIEQLGVHFDLSRLPEPLPEEHEPKSEVVSPLQKKAWLRIQRAGEASEAAQAAAALVHSLIHIDRAAQTDSAGEGIP
jgi:hypothetical protein